MANLSTIEEKKKKKGGQGNKGRTSKKKTTPKKDTKITMNLKDFEKMGIKMSPGMLKEFKEKGYDPAKLLKIKSSGMGTHYKI